MPELTELQDELISTLYGIVSPRNEEASAAMIAVLAEINARLDRLEARNKHDDDCCMD